MEYSIKICQKILNFECFSKLPIKKFNTVNLWSKRLRLHTHREKTHSGRTKMLQEKYEFCSKVVNNAGSNINTSYEQQRVLHQVNSVHKVTWITIIHHRYTSQMTRYQKLLAATEAYVTDYSKICKQRKFLQTNQVGK